MSRGSPMDMFATAFLISVVYHETSVSHPQRINLHYPIPPWPWFSFQGCSLQLIFSLAYTTGLTSTLSGWLPAIAVKVIPNSTTVCRWSSFLASFPSKRVDLKFYHRLRSLHYHNRVPHVFFTSEPTEMIVMVELLIHSLLLSCDKSHHGNYW